MRGSFTLFQVAGIRIRVHLTFFLLLLLGASHWGGQYGASGAAFGVLLITLLFACVTLHELSHSLVAKRFGIPVTDILLLPIGGVSALKRRPEKPAHELVIALAGPLTNVVIAAILVGVAGAAGDLRALARDGLVEGSELVPGSHSLLVWLIAANVTLAVFNLIPAFPMDGGRVLRALLSFAMPAGRATLVAAGVGQVIALALGLYAILNAHLVLALIALFVFLGAGQEAAEHQARTVLSTLRAGDVYNKHALVLSPADHVSTVVDYLLTSYQPDFAVVHGGELLGIVTRQDILKTLGEEPRDVYVAGIMKREVLRVAAGVSVEAARETMREQEARVAAVFSGDRYLGLVSLEDLAEVLLIATMVNRRKQLAEGPSGEGGPREA